MDKDLRKRIRAAWRHIEDLEPNISTEQLYARVMDQCSCSMEDVTEAVI